MASSSISKHKPGPDAGAGEETLRNHQVETKRPVGRPPKDKSTKPEHNDADLKTKGLDLNDLIDGGTDMLSSMFDFLGEHWNPVWSDSDDAAKRVIKRTVRAVKWNEKRIGTALTTSAVGTAIFEIGGRLVVSVGTSFRSFADRRRARAENTSHKPEPKPKPEPIPAPSAAPAPDATPAVDPEPVSTDTQPSIPQPDLGIKQEAPGPTGAEPEPVTQAAQPVGSVVRQAPDIAPSEK